MSYDDDLGDDNDDDVFKKSDSSSESPSAEGFAINVNNVPGYLRNALERYISENPQIQDSFRNFRDPSPFTHFITLFILFDQSLYHFSPSRITTNSSYIRAVAHLLDDQYEGLVQRLTNVYDLESKLQMMHANYIAVVDIHTTITNHEAPSTKLSETMIRYLGALADIYNFSLSKLIQKYTDACEGVGIIPDLQLLEFGIKSEGDFAYASTNTYSQVSIHYKYGDVSSINAAYEASHRGAFIKFLLPIIFADDKQASELLYNHANPN